MKTLILAAISIVLIGCGQNASKMGSGAAQDIVNQITYVVDPHTGFCYAVVASRKDFEMHQNGFTITWVPNCPKK